MADHVDCPHAKDGEQNVENRQELQGLHMWVRKDIRHVVNRQKETAQMDLRFGRGAADGIIQRQPKGKSAWTDCP